MPGPGGESGAPPQPGDIFHIKRTVGKATRHGGMLGWFHRATAGVGKLAWRMTRKETSDGSRKEFLADPEDCVLVRRAATTKHWHSYMRKNYPASKTFPASRYQGPSRRAFAAWDIDYASVPIPTSALLLVYEELVGCAWICKLDLGNTPVIVHINDIVASGEGGGRVEALFDYTASAEDEISLKSGAIVDDVCTVDGGWAEGTLQGKRGLFPESYCRDVPADPANTKTKVGSMEALYDYTASAEDEISLKSGAIVDDVLIIDEGWAEGTLQGKRGLFPKNYCRDVPADPANTKTKVGSMEALFDYTASAEDEISLKSGAIVDDVLIIDEGWAEGTLQGKRGLFPKNYCRDVPADPANTKTKVGASIYLKQLPAFEIEQFHQYSLYLKWIQEMTDDLAGWKMKHLEESDDGYLFLNCLDDVTPGHSVSCDVCLRKGVLAPRFHCMVCRDFDICMSCWWGLDGQNCPNAPAGSFHEITRIVCHCECCAMVIIGTRFHCEECNDLDLCISCHHAGRTPLKHESSHEVSYHSTIYNPDKAARDELEDKYHAYCCGLENEKQKWAEQQKAAATKTQLQGGNAVYVCALYDYIGRAEDELSFSAGDILLKTGNGDDAGWFKGSFNGKEGIFPANYCREM